MAKRRPDVELMDILTTWDILNQNLTTLSSEELERMLDLEVAEKARWSFLKRILHRIILLQKRELMATWQKRAREYRAKVA